MNLSWAINRVSSMSIPEVTFRFREQVRREMMRSVSRGWEQFDKSSGPRPIIPTLQMRFLEGCDAQLVAALEASVDSFLAGHFSALGQTWPRRSPGGWFPREWWLVDPVTLRTWPSDRYCFDVEYKNSQGLGDIKYVWQLNRLQFLPPIAAIVALRSRPEAKCAFSNILSSWMSTSEPFRGVCWNSGIELALRSISLILAVSLCAEAIEESEWVKIRRFLAAHFYWLRRYPSRYSSANNHCVAEALAGYVIGSLMPDLSNAKAHALESRDILHAQAMIQLQEDGSAAEQSLVYGSFTAEMILFACLVGRCLGDDFSPDVLSRLVSFADVVNAFASSSGRTPDLGDDDDTRVVSLCHSREDRYPMSIARAICAFTNRLAPPMSPRSPELRDALFGPLMEGRRPEEGLRTLPIGGYSIVSERRGGRLMKLVMDHGPLGFLSIAAHGHADANSFVLSLDEQPVIVDPGTYLYHSGGRWRDWFRGTPAHNTLNIAGVNQSVITGPFNWGRKAKANLVSAIRAPDWSLVAQHDGYVKSFGVIHERQISADREGILVFDRLLPGGSKQVVEVVYQFAPDLEVSCSGSSCLVSKDERPLLTLEFDVEGEVDVQCGREESCLGWVSPSFGIRAAAPRLSWSGVLGASGLRTRIKWSSEEARGSAEWSQ